MHRLSQMVANELRSNGNLVRPKPGCICTNGFVEDIVAEGVPDIFLLHPHDSNKTGCYDKVRKFVEEFPQARFVIFAFDDYRRDEPRVQGIGEFPNVAYVDQRNSREVIGELMSAR